MSGDRLARAAESLAGTPFRLRGRDPRTGLDCVGLLVAALGVIGRPVPAPSGYGMRNTGIGLALEFAPRMGLVDAEDAILPGDVLLLDVGPLQQHLLIALAGNRFVHAHAGLGRVVVMPGPLTDMILRHWRLAS